MPDNPLTLPVEEDAVEASHPLLDSELERILRRKARARVTFLICWIAFVGCAAVVACYYLKLFFPMVGGALFTLVTGSVVAIVMVFGYDARSMIRREIHDAALFLSRPFTAYEAPSRYPSFFVARLGQRTRLHLYSGKPLQTMVMGKVRRRHPDSSYEFNPDEAQALYDCLVDSDQPVWRRAAEYIAKRD